MPKYRCPIDGLRLKHWISESGLDHLQCANWHQWAWEVVRRPFTVNGYDEHLVLRHYDATPVEVVEAAKRLEAWHAAYKTKLQAELHPESTPEPATDGPV